jgi:hypothetical protein
MVDNGAAGVFSQYGSSLSASTFIIDVTGLQYTFQYRFFIEVTNVIGTSSSNVVSAIVADPPTTPSFAPTFDPTETNTSSIFVIMPVVVTSGGSPILSYHLQRTEYGSSQFFDVIGAASNMSVETKFLVRNLTKSFSYRFRYQAINSIGASGWSPESYLYPAVVPDAPAQPTYISSSDSQIVIAFQRSQNDGGLAVTNYDLEMDAGDIASSFSPVTGYSFSTNGYSYIVLAAQNAMTAGLFYRF